VSYDKQPDALIRFCELAMFGTQRQYEAGETNQQDCNFDDSYYQNIRQDFFERIAP
jgi:hypothetical protein